MRTATVVGAGPAGLMAAEALVDAGFDVSVADQKPSVGRKFLMAGKSGLNLTKDELFDQFCAAYQEAEGNLRPMLSAFGPNEVSTWAGALEQEIFIGSSGRVFPKAMKASPLLRAWLARLADKGVMIQTRWAWAGFEGDNLRFETPDGPIVRVSDVTVLAMGGVSWRRLGSDGEWAKHLSDIAPFKPSNMGFVVDWSAFMGKHFGTPIKNIAIKAGEFETRGEAVVTSRGLEGGAIYAASARVRDGAAMTIDLLPDQSIEALNARWAKPKGKETFTNLLRKRLKLDPVKVALLNEFARPFPTDMVSLVKNLPIPIQGPAPIDEAISTAGGVRFEDLDENLMLKRRPGIFVAGEMLNWEAPTGGYLITACLATGLWAGQGASRWVG